jgi:MULE transposase domain/SWIM zinc finger
MDTSLRYVRPVVSLDAMHLKSVWKGTLYIASTKTACDEIYPVAFAIARGNENMIGWKWFLELLGSSIRTLSMDHPKPGITKKYFSFISDRQKGLTEALAMVFPENHSCSCAIHIARNVERQFGKSVSKYVPLLAKTYSDRESEELLMKIGQKSQTGRRYLESIRKDHWRNIAWLENPTLPPRYGVRTSNTSESANSMFESSRDGTWLHTVETMLSKMVLRIISLREKHKGKSGVVDKMASKVRNQWESCLGCKVANLRENGRMVTIFRQKRTTTEDPVSYNIDLVDKTCDCGEWQEHGVPCIHAIAYFRMHQNMSLQHILDEHVDRHYTYEHERLLLKNNITPVCIERVSRDAGTLPPTSLNTRSTGRPKKVRLRKRSRWAHEPDKSNISCKRCHQRGHNVRTCLVREALARQSGKVNGTTEGALENDSIHELDLE